MQGEIDRLYEENRKLREEINSLKLNPEIIVPVNQVSSEEEIEDPEDDNLKFVHMDTFNCNSGITSVKFSPSNNFLSCGSEDGVVRVWNIGPNSARSVTTIHGNSRVSALEWEQNSGSLLLCASIDGKVKIWNVQGDKCVGEVSTPSGYKRVQDIRCSPVQNNHFAVSCASESGKGVLLIWDLVKLQIVNRLKLEPATVLTSFDYNHNGTVIVGGSSDGYMRIFDVSNSKSIARWKAHQTGVSSVKFSFDETKIYSVGEGNELFQWSAHSSKQLQSYEYEGRFPDQRQTYRTNISINNVGSHFLVGSQYNRGLVYNINDPIPIAHLGGHNGPVVCTDWHPLENICVTGSSDYTVNLWKGN
eukprot:TRINITY_DN4608_c0_g2_i1.p1 TRINITY_DN4608_c0_g2~~TRINITY_DN4608_c0_g2_i1.p1  ORF type:complete len:401 (-),score=83.13 TRINITY_DN4608_c0_g2_i1:58-1137(-)